MNNPVFQDIQRYFRPLFIHRLRTFLSTLGVLFGVAAMIVMLSIGEGAKQDVLEQIEQLGIKCIIIRQQPLSEDQQSQQQSAGLSLQDAGAITLNIPWLIYTVPIRVIENATTNDFTQLSPEILATTRSYGEMKELQLTEGRFLCDLDQKEKRLVCVLGYEIAKNLGQEGHIGNHIRIDHIHYEIIGVLKSTNWKGSKNQTISHRNLDKTLFIPLGSERILKKSQSLAKQSLSELILQIQHKHQMDNTVQLVKKILEKLHHGYEDYQFIIPQELLQQAYRTQYTFNCVLGSIAAISLLIGGIGIMNMMLFSVAERTREIGIRRAIGAKKQHILLQFLIESLLLTLIGTLIGVVLGFGLSLGISYLVGWTTIVTSWSLFLAVTMSCSVGLCSGLYPAFLAARMDPIIALRYGYN